MHNILITGAKGQLGSEIKKLTQESTANHYFYTDVDELDITNKAAVSTFVADNKIDIIINCAAYTQVDKAEDDHATAFLINTTAPQNLAQVAATSNATLFHISTDYVFDGNHSIPYTETDPTSPLGVYGKSKLHSEELIQLSGCSHIIIRTSWLYSTFGNNFVKTIGRLSKEKEQLKVVFDQVGTPTYAHDLATAILTIINSGQFKNRNQTYHFSNEGVCSWYDFAIAINHFFGHNCNIQPCHSTEFPTKVTRPHFSVLDKTKIKEHFGVVVPHWRESLGRAIGQMNRNG